MNIVEITGDSLTIDDVVNVVDNGYKVLIGSHAIKKIQQASSIVEEIIEFEIPAYGINTGFGVNSKISIPIQNTIQLQKNLIKSHSSAVGKPYDNRIVKAAMLLRANCFATGYSGVRLELEKKLVEMINKDVIPIVPSTGSLGSSGDLVFLAHTALPLYGEGFAKLGGEIMTGKEAMSEAGIDLLPLSHKEGLAFTNGFVYGTAIGALAINELDKISNALDMVTAMLIESLAGITIAYDEKLHSTRPHEGVVEFAAQLRNNLNGSTIIDSRGKFNVHSAYAIKCAPQIMGGLRVAMHRAKKTIEIEMNSATDNPLLFRDEMNHPLSLSGGNFHGQPVGLDIAYLNIALVSSLFKGLNGLVTRLVDSNLNDGLPGFLVNNTGLESGFMISQYVLAAIYSKAQNLAIPHVTGNIPVCGMAEDVNSMASEDAKNLYQLVDLAYEALAIGLVTATQGLFFRTHGYTRDLYEINKKMINLMSIAHSNELMNLNQQFREELLGAQVEEVVLGKGTGRVYEAVINRFAKQGYQFPYHDDSQPMSQWLSIGKNMLMDGTINTYATKNFF